MRPVTAAIVLAAGRGLRLRSDVPKALIEINSKPIVVYALSALSHHPTISDIILVVNAKNERAIITKLKQYRIGKIKAIVRGGKRRQDSVAEGLKVLDKRTDLVLIHDAVRPFINQELVSSIVKAAARYRAVVCAVPIKETIKEVTSGKWSFDRLRTLRPGTLSKVEVSVASKLIVKKTLDRDKLWEIQTPQVFKKDLVLEAYRKFGHTEVTDDASLVEKLGFKVRLVMGSYFNIKVTTPEDLIFAEAIAKQFTHLRGEVVAHGKIR